MTPDTDLKWIAESLLKLPKQKIRGLGAPFDGDVYEVSMGSQVEWLSLKEFVKPPYSSVIMWLVIAEMERRGFNNWQISCHLHYQVGVNKENEHRWRVWTWKKQERQFISEPSLEPWLAVFDAARRAVEGR